MGEAVEEAHEIRLKRLRMRSWRRGTKEMDLLLGPYADERLEGMGPSALDRYEALIAEPDTDLYAWVVGREAAPEPYGALIAAIREAAERRRA
jgi:antitoxin CptB